MRHRAAPGAPRAPPYPSGDITVKGKIIDALAGLAVPVDSLQLYPGNPREGDVDAIARSLDRFHQRKPIVITTGGTVVAGNHTLLAAKRLGWESIAAVTVPDDEATARAYLLADNRTNELGTYDPMALAALLEAVQLDDPDLLAAISYSTEDLDDLLARIEEEPARLIEHVAPPTKYGGGDEGSFIAPAHPEALDAYRVKGVRSIILDYPLEQFEPLAAQVAELRKLRQLDSTSALFAQLVAEALA